MLHTSVPSWVYRPLPHSPMSCDRTPAHTPAESQHTMRCAPPGELGGGPDVLGAWRPAVHLSGAPAEPLQGTPAGPPEGTQTSAPTLTARRSANRSAWDAHSAAHGGGGDGSEHGTPQQRINRHVAATRSASTCSNGEQPIHCQVRAQKITDIRRRAHWWQG
jgi:hypothetical protein